MHRVIAAGPTALLVAKLHKVAERISQPARQRPRDAHDVYRPLRGIDRRLCRGVHASDGCRRQPVTQEAFAYLDTHFPTPTAAGAAQVAAAVDGLVEVPGEVARLCAILASQVLAALC